MKTLKTFRTVFLMVRNLFYRTGVTKRPENRLNGRKVLKTEQKGEKER